MLMVAIARIEHGYRAIGMLLVRGYGELGRLYAHYRACPHGMFHGQARLKEMSNYVCGCATEVDRGDRSRRTNVLCIGRMVSLKSKGGCPRLYQVLDKADSVKARKRRQSLTVRRAPLQWRPAN